MDADFWHAKWHDNAIAFHEGEANALLRDHVERLPLAARGRIFLPLCGKTRDIAYLAERGCEVVGVELSQLAVAQLFEEADLEPLIEQAGPLTRFRAGRVSVFAGDIFALSQDMLGPVDAVYDRAALIALPPDMRAAYARHVIAITGAAPQFLITVDYDQSCIDGPPFSVPEAELQAQYGRAYEITNIARRPISGALAERCSGVEEAWLLEPRAARRDIGAGR